MRDATVGPTGGAGSDPTGPLPDEPTVSPPPAPTGHPTDPLPAGPGGITSGAAPPGTGGLGRVLTDVLVELLPEGTDSAALADVLWLAAGSTPVPPANPSAGEAAGPGGGVERAGGARSAGEPDRPRAADPAAPAPAPVPEPRPALALYETLPGTPAPPGTPVTVAAGPALPGRLRLARALRPFSLRWTQGPRRVLDLAATVRHSLRAGELLPVLGPAPEPWFDVLLVVDDSPSMAVWADTVAEFTSLLAGLGTFRRVDTVRLLPGDEPRVVDRAGRTVAPGRVAAPGGRRLVLVVSDCTAGGWYAPRSWQLVRHWAARVPVALINPLPGRLWGRTALDLPAVRVTHRTPAAANRDLEFTAPLLPAPPPAPGGGPVWVALPTLTFSPHSLGRWARGFAHGAPEGYDAVLLPASGTLPTPFDAPGPAGASPDAAEAFLRTGTPAAVRLAALCSPFSRIGLRLLQLIRQEVVPEAGLGEVAELLTSGVLAVERTGGAPPVLVFQGTARRRLTSALARRDAWLMHSALTRYIAAHPPSPRGLGAVAVETSGSPLPDDPRDDEELRPFAEASGELLRVLRGGGRAAPVVPKPEPEPEPETEPEPELETVSPLPDPERSAAVLIGVSAYTRLPRLWNVADALDEMRGLLTSPAGWNLPDYRCVTVLDPPDARAVLEAVQAACDRAEDALFLYIAARTLESDGPELPAWAVPDSVPGEARATGVPFDKVLRIVHGSSVRRVMVVLDHTLGMESTRELTESGTRVSRSPSTHLMVCEPLLDRPRAASIHRFVEQGLPGGPRFLGVPEVLTHLAELSGRQGLTSASWTEGRLPLALGRNRLAGEGSPLEFARRSVYGQMYRIMPFGAEAELLPDAERLLTALLWFMGPDPARTVRSLSPGDPSPLLDELTEYLERRGFDLRPGTLDGGPDYFCSPNGSSSLFPFEVKVRAEGRGSGDSLPWSLNRLTQYPSPIAFLLVLEPSRNPVPPPLGERVSVVDTSRGGEPDERSCVVTLRLPVSLTSAQPGPDEEEHVPERPEDLWESYDRSLHEVLRDAVDGACENLAGREVATLLDGYPHRDGGGLDLEDVDIPALLDSPTVKSVHPDRSTLDWHSHEEYDHGLVVGEVTVEAEITIEGFMTKSAFAFHEHEVDVLDGDWNDDTVWASVSRSVVLTFHAQVEPPPFDAELELQAVASPGPRR
ncbi:SAV_2336 N-terminal domain-related protein [Streptomyces sp. NPDC001889]